MKIVIGIATYNRLKVLNMMAKSLYVSDLAGEYEIRIYDDASNEFDLNELKRIFPNAAGIHRNPVNYGADRNLWLMYRDLLNSDGDAFFNADSDLIFHKDWMHMIDAFFELTDGVLSLFNTQTHQILKEDVDLVEKASLGSAGTIFSREVLEEIVNSSSVSKSSMRGLDWAWSDHIRGSGKRLFATKRSYVQHIGFTGYNGRGGRFDYGEMFDVDSVLNGQIINDVVTEFSHDMYGKGEKLGYYLFPFENVERGKKVVIYGAGVVGSDYCRQILVSCYCEIVAIVDKNKKAEKIFPIEYIRELDFDYIVLASIKEENIESMIGDIQQVDEKILKKIVYANVSNYIHV